MELDWQVKDHTSRGTFWEAEYEAYDTPEGPAIATAKVSPDVYFPGRYTYETWIEDPYLKEAGANRYYARFAYGSGDEQHAIDVCEDYGYRQATACLGNFDIAKLYEEAFPLLVERYLESCGMIVDEVIYAGRFRVQARVREGGYEPNLVDVWLEDDLSISIGY